MKLVLTVSVLAVTVPEMAGQPSKVGTFDAPSIVVAFYRSPQWNRVVRDKVAQRDDATRRSDAQKVKELEEWGGSQQELAHKQLSGEAPLANVFDGLEPGFAEAARAAHVDVIVPEPLWTDPSVERIDVTSVLLDWLQADERTRKIISGLRAQRKEQSSPPAETGGVGKQLMDRIEIGGYLCGRAWAWFYSNGRLKSCTIARATAFGETHIPVGSWISLTPDGKPLELVLKRDSAIAGITCRGLVSAGPQGPVTQFYPDGKLKLCWPAADTDVQGVPCASAAPVEFDSTGGLRTCQLSRPYRNEARGGRYVATH